MALSLKRFLCNPAELCKRIARMHLRTKLIFSFIGIILIVCFSLSLLMIRVVSDDMTQAASQNLHSAVAQNDKVIDSILRQYEKTSTHILANQNLYEFSQGFRNLPNSDIISDIGVINPILASYFSDDTLYSCHLYTSRYVYGTPNANPVSPDFLLQSGLIDTARRAGGAPVWVAGYDYGKTYQIDYLNEKTDYPYRHLITMVREMNFSYVARGVYHSLPGGAEAPVLLVNINEPSLRGIYTNEIPYPENTYLIFNEKGRIVSSNDAKNPPAREAPEEFTRFLGKTGFSVYPVAGERFLFCYDTIEHTGWTSVIAVPLSAVVRRTTQHVEEGIVLLSVFLILIAVTLSALLSTSITRPIRRITASVRRFAKGDLHVRMPEESSRDFQELTATFNRMVEQINRLIRENYDSAMRQKEAQINMLTMQINPHFLYNTLNTFSMLSLENGDQKTSDLIISLSQMLSYALKNQSDTADLAEEIKWLKNYISIMQVRYEGIFTFSLDIPPEFCRCEVPKLSLQTFIENAIVHGFADRESGGVIEVRAYAGDGRLFLEVRDNGCGFDTAVLERPPQKQDFHSRIGIRNVRERIRLLYGEEYGVDVRSAPGQGTAVTLALPWKRL